MLLSSEIIVNNSLGQDAEVAFICELAAHLVAKSFVDIGAERGSIASAMFSCGLSGVMFEPLPKHLKALQEMALEYGGAVYPWAIAEADATRNFFVASDEHGVELDHFHSLERLDNDPRFQHGQAFDVVCRSLSSLIAEGILTVNPGVLKIDTEGRDLAVLQGIGVMRPELVICEFFTQGLYNGWHAAEPRLAIDHMRSCGYERFVAFKRVEGFEQCVMGPCAFLPRQWGNLFFFSDALFKRAERTITTFLADCERNLVEHWIKVAEDRVAKEQIIRQLAQCANSAARNQATVASAIEADMSNRSLAGNLPDCVVSAMLARTQRREKSIVIDVGAHRGEFAKSVLRQFDINKVFAFEPNADNFNKLQALLSDHPQILVSSSAVGEHDGVASFGCNADDATGSVLSYADTTDTAKCSERQRVSMVALDTFCCNFAGEGRDIGLIKIDTQGYDLNVLKGCEQTLLEHEPVVLLEFIFVPLYVDQATPFDIEAWMRMRGYGLVGLANIHVDGNGLLAFADALFVPRSVALPLKPKFRQIDSEGSWRAQAATFERICAERLAVIETLDAEVTRLKCMYERAG